ncbi:hypothetical protein [uncultured Megasphaera sp.]|uniref:hypothetical protein n=1 Tax=uncultured Megasphaera sp. TaxID=165188 RepID=UPI002631718E|nr:hypothetical protein [uncultured Megasphaera sp.]
MNEGKRYVAIPQIVIAYDQMNGYLERFAQSHQDDAVLVGQVRLLQNYNILLENHDDMFARLMMLLEYHDSKVCLICKNVHLVQALLLAYKIAESSGDFDAGIIQTLELNLRDTKQIIDALGQWLQKSSED